MKLDLASIKILNFGWKYSKAECLKLANNGLNLDEFNAIRQLIQDCKIKILFFDYNCIRGNDLC